MKLNNKIMLITYADSLGNDLNELKSVIDKYYAKAVGGIHILPFFISYKILVKLFIKKSSFLPKTL